MSEAPPRTGDCPVAAAPDQPTSEASASFVTPVLVPGGKGGARAQTAGARPAVAWTKRSRGADDVQLAAKRPTIHVHPDAPLTPLQSEVLQNFVSRMDDPDASVVITNPRVPDNPIVYVTERWQDMCGYSYGEAVGRNPRLTQGASTSLDTVRSITHALKQQSACKVRLVNYRGGQARYPFWNFLSINPIFNRGELMLYAASLQDYSYHMDRLVSLSPAQFCRALEHYQRGRHIDEPLTALQLAKPTVYEADVSHPLVDSTRAARFYGTTTPRPIKRLGWNKLTLEPEYLQDRVCDTLQTMGVNYELSSRADGDGEICAVHANTDGVAMRIMVAEDATDGRYTVNVTRVSGDTFKFHAIYRDLRGRLQLE